MPATRRKSPGPPRRARRRSARKADEMLTWPWCSDEPVFEEDEIQEYYDPEPGEDDENQFQNGDEEADNVIISGDPSAAANQGKGLSEKSIKDKKIATEERTTTPYMTKYEKARILGTRALQIR